MKFINYLVVYILKYSTSYNILMASDFTEVIVYFIRKKKKYINVKVKKIIRNNKKLYFLNIKTIVKKQFSVYYDVFNNLYIPLYNIFCIYFVLVYTSV